jgi:hypothetical protein
MPDDPYAATKARIAEINAIIGAGASSATVDGVTISWDFENLRKERAELESSLPSDQTKKRRRPLMYGNDLGGGF